MAVQLQGEHVPGPIQGGLQDFLCGLGPCVGRGRNQQAERQQERRHRQGQPQSQPAAAPGAANPAGLGQEQQTDGGEEERQTPEIRRRIHHHQTQGQGQRIQQKGRGHALPPPDHPGVDAGQSPAPEGQQQGDIPGGSGPPGGQLDRAVGSVVNGSEPGVEEPGALLQLLPCQKECSCQD